MLEENVGVLGYQLIGLVVLLNKLTVVVCRQFLFHNLPVLMTDVPLRQRQHMWLMHNGAQPYSPRITGRHLN